MATLIKNAKIINDSWQRLEWTADGSLPPVPESGDVLVPLRLWQGLADELLARSSGKLGLWLDSDEDPVLIADSLEAFSVIAVHFPQFTDGRGYSTARLLRERHGYDGELRAFGDIGRDQIFFLNRVGFDAFVIGEGKSADEALAAFDDFPESYQGDAVQPLPLFRRRAA